MSTLFTMAESEPEEVSTCLESSLDLCVHCQTSFPSILQDSEFSKRELAKALTTIFKLKYLTAFDILRKDEADKAERNLELWSLCPNCSQTLINLHQIYNDFLQLGKLDSYLAKEINRLDEIIDRHLLKDKISDSHVMSTVKNEEDDNSFLAYNEELNQQDNSPFAAASSCEPTFVDLNSKEESQEKMKRRPKKRFTESSIMNEPQPRIILTRLSGKYAQPRVIISKEEMEDLITSQPDDDLSKSEDEDDDEYEPEPKNIKHSKSLSKLSENRTDSQIKKGIKSSLKLKLKSSAGTGHEVHRGPFLNIRLRHIGYYLTRRTTSANPCWYCRLRNFATPAECVEHTKSEHLPNVRRPQVARVCERCAKICPSSKRLSTHLLGCEKIPCGVLLPKKFPCPQCPKSFGSKKGLKDHVDSHSTERPYPCDQCHYRAKNTEGMKKHLRLKHALDSGQKKVQCDECQVFSKNEETLKLHKYNMHTVEGYKKYRESQRAYLDKRKEKKKGVVLVTHCEDCNVDFFSRLALINHRRNFHADNMQREHMCHLCGKDFSSLQSLRMHSQRVHTDERPFICHHCGKGFKVNYSLVSHMEQTHSEEGRLRYNQKTREKNQRRKLVARQMASLLQGHVQVDTENYNDTM